MVNVVRGAVPGAKPVGQRAVYPGGDALAARDAVEVTEALNLICELYFIEEQAKRATLESVGS